MDPSNRAATRNIKLQQKLCVHARVHAVRSICLFPLSFAHLSDGWKIAHTCYPHAPHPSPNDFSPEVILNLFMNLDLKCESEESEELRHHERNISNLTYLKNRLHLASSEGGRVAHGLTKGKEQMPMCICGSYSPTSSPSYGSSLSVAKAFCLYLFTAMHFFFITVTRTVTNRDFTNQLRRVWSVSVLFAKLFPQSRSHSKDTCLVAKLLN